MKTHRFIGILAGLFISLSCAAQQQGTLSRFLIGTDPFKYTMSKVSSQTQYNEGPNTVETDSNGSTSHTISAHINLFVGYFVTKNICTGLEFGKNAIISPFFRYYPFRKNHDSSMFDFFFQANFTFYNNNTNHPAEDNIDTTFHSFQATSSYSVNTNAFTFNIGIAAAWNFAPRWALEGEIGYGYANTVTKTGAYTTSSGQPGFISYSTTSATKNASLGNQEFLQLMLSYRL